MTDLQSVSSVGLPKKLFKYKSIAGDGLGYLIDIVNNNRLHFEHPSKFNDPFELLPRLDMDIHSPQFKQEYCEALDAYIRRRNPSASKVKRLRLVEETYRDFLTRGVTDEVRNIFRMNAVCCLSTNENNLLMWAHYCVGHNGCLLEFNTDLWNKEEIRTAFEVDYVSERPIAYVWKMLRTSLITGQKPTEAETHDIGKAAVACKSEDWKYEGEWRLFRRGPGYGTFNPESLTRIIIGVGVSKTDATKISNVIRDRASKITVEWAELDSENYRINYKSQRH